MNRKKPVEPDQVRMPADEFDEIMRRALGVPSPARSEHEPKKDAEEHETNQPSQTNKP
jgi:hypothetical protein